MKIIVCGKGGSGKSTVSTLLAKALKKSGFNVLVIDADDSNLGLHRLMGAEAPVILMDNLGGKKGFKQKTQSAFPGAPGGLFTDQMTLDEVPAECVSEIDGIKLLAMGKIHASGEGCACPMGRLSKMILSRLVIEENDIVVIDTAAGVEHFGRGLDASCDLVLGVVDPTYESFLLAEKISKMAEDAGLAFSLVLNKVDAIVDTVMKENVAMEQVIGCIDNSDAVFKAGLKGNPLDESITGLGGIVETIRTLKQN